MPMPLKSEYRGKIMVGYQSLLSKRATASIFFAAVGIETLIIALIGFPGLTLPFLIPSLFVVNRWRTMNKPFFSCLAISLMVHRAIWCLLASSLIKLAPIDAQGGFFGVWALFAFVLIEVVLIVFSYIISRFFSR